jgi:hypothetical protein
MSFDSVRLYFKARCEAVGLVEHDDAFNADNIPDTVIDGSYHVSFNSFNGIKSNQNDQELSVPVTVEFYVKGFRYPNEGVDSALILAEALIKEVQKPVNRLGQVLKNISTSDGVIEPITLANDNIIRVRIIFNVVMVLDLT